MGRSSPNGELLVEEDGGAVSQEASSKHRRSQVRRPLENESYGTERESQSEREGEGEEGENGAGRVTLEVGQVVRVKVLNVSLPLPRHLTNFHHEHQVVASLRDVEGVVRVVARLSRPGVEALVLEDFGGASLDKWLARDGPFAAGGTEGVKRFVSLALSVARTLGHIHSRSVVHKDLKVHQPKTNFLNKKG
jgi:serine/threonine protein kinase